MSGATSGIGLPVFSDDFAQRPDGKINPDKWNFNVWTPPDGGGSYYGKTQQRQELPGASNGVMRLKLDTWNPPPPDWGNKPWPPNGNYSFFGSEAISKQTFGVGTGIAFEARMRYAQPQAGIMGGFFTFAGPPTSHDEIDFELVSTKQNDVQSNIYHNRPLEFGNPKFHALSTPLTEWHTYRIEWTPTSVRWLVDGNEVRRTDDPREVPAKPMNLHFNIWGQNPNTPPYSDPSLTPATSPGANRSFFLEVDSTKVEKISTRLGTSGEDNLAGGDLNDFIEGYGAKDQLAGGRGNDNVDGGDGNDVLRGAQGDDTLSGQAGDDRLFGTQGRDDLLGGAGADRLDGGQAADKLEGGAGADVIWWETASDSSGPAFDQIQKFNFGEDSFQLPSVAGPIQAIDPTKTTGTLNSGSAFNTGLTAAMTQLAAHHAVLFRPDAGSFAGKTFLVVDVNGVAGYQSGQDVVAQMVGSTGNLTTANFV